MQAILKTLMFPFTLLALLLSAVLGKFKWQLPPWLDYLNQLRRRSFAKFLFLIGALCLFIFGNYKAIDYFQNLPEALLITAQIELPLTVDVYDPEDPEKVHPPFGIRFEYNKQDPELGSPSVAPIELLGATLKGGVKLSPAKEGEWIWKDDRSLVFMPSSAWPAGQKYTVSFAPEVFSTQDTFDTYEYDFTTPELQANVEGAEFYLDPQSNHKSIQVEYSFNYAIEPSAFKQQVDMAYLTDSGVSDVKREAINNLQSKVSADGLSAAVMFVLDELPDAPRLVEASLKQGLVAKRGGEGLATDTSVKVSIPDVYSYLKVEDFSVDILRNPENEPQQFVLLRFTDPITKDELLNKLNIYRLPKHNEKNGKRYWQNPREVTSQVLNSAQTIDFVLMPNKKDHSTTYQLRIDEVQGQQYYFKIDAGIRSVNGFIYKSFYDRIFVAPEYPQEVVINGEGSVMTYSKDQRLAFTSRGLNAVQVSIGKIINDELYHLVSQTRGDISNPDFNNWSFGPENLASFSKRVIPMADASKSPKEASYASVDLNGLVSKTNSDVGLFLIEINGWDNRRGNQIYGVSDKRLVLVTDLGLIIKTNADNSQEIFVQSISSGKPAANVKVELLGKNGKSLFTRTTNELGHASMPSARDFQREQQATVFVASVDGDVSFIPYDRYTRQINYSRFDVSGLYDYGGDANAGVSGFVFSDRGIYRPGESVDLAGIVKGKGFKDLAGIPLELIIRDSQYNEVKVHKFTLPQQGMFEHRMQTESDFVTGEYSASLHLVRTKNQGRHSDGRVYTRQYRDRQIGYTDFSIEAFQPDTMTVANKVDGLRATTGWITGNAISNTVTLSNLFGSPAQQRIVTSELRLNPSEFRFKPFDGFRFNVIGANASSEIEGLDLPVKEAETDANGEATFTFDLRSTSLGELRAGAFAAYNSVEAYEPSGGRSVRTSSTFRYSPLSFMLGFSADGDLSYLNKDAERKLSLVAIDNQLTSIELENIEQRLSKIIKVSTLVEQYNGRYQYQTIEQKEQLSSDIINISKMQPGEASVYKQVILNTSTAGSYLLEFVDAQGRLLSALNYTVVGATNDTGKLAKDAELSLSLNKSDFSPGEEIELSIQAPYKGNGLISIESNKLHSFTWFTADTKNSIQRIRVPNDLEGNAYVNVAFVRDTSSREILTSPLSYAVKPFSINRDKRRIDIEIATPDIAEPGKSMEMNVDLSQDAKLLVFAVDLGILNVANYQTPNPLSFFLQKRALSVRTMQILDLILPDFALSNMLSAAGGDMEMRAEEDMFAEKIMVSGSRRQRTNNPFARQEKKPVVFWSGIIDAKKGNNKLSYDVPEDFAGGLRVMAIATGQGTVGSAQQSLLVRGPFVISPNILNQAAPGDEFDISVSVANLVESTQAGEANAVEIVVRSSEHLSFVQGSQSALNINAENELLLNMQLLENQEDALRFRVKANEILGEAKVEFDVSMTDANGKVYKGSRSASMSVRPASAYSVHINTGASKDGELSIDSPLEFFEQESVYSLRASSSPLVIADGLSNYLAAYPHGCTEQMVSQVFPLIGLSNLPAYTTNPSTNTKAQKALEHFNEVIKKLRTRQSYSGGFAYWPNREDNNFEVSIYVMHFLIEAESLGYPVPSDMLSSGVAFLNNTLSEFANEQRVSPRTQNATLLEETTEQLALRNRAHAIYLLTRSGIVTSNLIIDLLDDAPGAWKEDLMASYIAASYALMQRSEDAHSLIKSYAYGKQGKALQAISGEAPALALDAQHLYLLAKHFPEQINRLSPDYMLSLTEDIFAGRYNTISASYSTLALGAYHSAMGDNESIVESDAAIEFMRYFTNEEMRLEPSFTPFPTVNYKARVNEINRVSAQHDSKALYYVDLQAGYETNLALDPVKQGIEIQRSFVNEDGQVITRLQQGEKAIVKLRVRSIEQANIDNIAIVDLLPGGFEVLRESVDRTSGPWRSDYIDIRDDRIVFYTSVSKRIKEITYTVQATAAGEFVVPASSAESMYDRSIKGVSAVSKFTVTAK
ncbi:alpha-2-macroglobulin [Glaciecola sp. MH2013]|uniref:alpha-2-macroglobulin n=1 Tax=Glaciecola sp. MH2013 TaxID=2785524 RepID=UPI0018A0F279|nr:alpha-2-macroglobulin [Glaciecola sp. MH2013]MBF7073498.1 alpha-2-macroglobulin [Glaciecola sp. MH2013]